MRAQRLLKTAVSAARPPPLAVLLHGFSGTRLQLVPAAAALSARGYDVLNFAYASRAQPLAAHAAALADAVRHRVESGGKVGREVHFVTHSFGGVVLAVALKEIGEAVEGQGEVGRSVLIAPPARGCVLARVMAGGGGLMEGGHGLEVPEGLRGVVRGAAGVFLGKGVGDELARLDEAWWAGRQEQHRLLAGKALVVAGNVGEVNPFIRGDSDGVVRVAETVLGVRHWRVEVRLTHNALVIAPRVCRMVAGFLDGAQVGELYVPEGERG